MKALLVQAASPPAYWGYQHALPFIAREAPLPPLGLATLAAHLPEHWELRLRDLHLDPLADDDLRWADAVLVSGMLVQERSMREVLVRARALGVPTVVGGPAPTTSPDAFPEASYLFLGEAEGRLGPLVETLESRHAELAASVRPERRSPQRSGVEGPPRILSPENPDRPDLSLCRVPRFDLLELDRYASHAIQVSRGCPFSCEFCDIIEMFGRTPRVKSPEQVLAELDALRRLGAHGPLFVVDDNFIGNRRAAARLVPEMAAWQRAHGKPFDLYTEASLDLAAEPALTAAMVDAGFSAVFVGLETPDPATLTRTGKKQNLKVEPGEAVRTLTRAGLEVFAGFIVGFDGDDAAALERQRTFVAALPIPRAMVGVLMALPGTALWRRLEGEGRLRASTNGDQFDRPNFETTMGDEALVSGYRELLAALFTPEAYFSRCELHLELAPATSSPLRPGSLGTLARAVWGLGVLGPRRRWFWRLLRIAARRGLGAFPRAISFAILGEHFIRYTAEEVLPRLDRRLAEMTRPAAAPRSEARRATGDRLVAVARAATTDARPSA